MTWIPPTTEADKVGLKAYSYEELCRTVKILVDRQRESEANNLSARNDLVRLAEDHEAKITKIENKLEEYRLLPKRVSLLREDFHFLQRELESKDRWILVFAFVTWVLGSLLLWRSW